MTMSDTAIGVGGGLLVLVTAADSNLTCPFIVRFSRYVPGRTRT